MVINLQFRDCPLNEVQTCGNISNTCPLGKYIKKNRLTTLVTVLGFIFKSLQYIWLQKFKKVKKGMFFLLI